MTPAEGRKQKRALMREIESARRRDARAKLVSLRQQIKDAKAHRREAIVHAKARCKGERIAARERARANRLRAVAELREAERRERHAARETCAIDLTNARSIADKVKRARVELDAERRYRAELKRIEQGNRRGRMLGAKPRAARSESDDEVRANLPPEFLGLWARVKGQIRASDRMTRTEAFLQYAHDHGSELLSALDDRTDQVIRDLEAKERAARREVRRARRASLPPAPF